MKKNRFITFLILTAIIVLSSCERDEVCIDPITPKLLIAFYDVDDTETEKPINNLAIEILDINNVSISLDTIGTDSISIPLNVYELQTTIVLTTDSYDTDFNRDTIRVSYETEDVFVGRSCGYKSIFNNVSISRDFNDADKWIKSLVLPQTEIENETEAHVTILH